MYAAGVSSPHSTWVPKAWSSRKEEDARRTVSAALAKGSGTSRPFTSTSPARGEQRGGCVGAWSPPSQCPSPFCPLSCVTCAAQPCRGALHGDGEHPEAAEGLAAATRLLLRRDQQRPLHEVLWAESTLSTPPHRAPPPQTPWILTCTRMYSQAPGKEKRRWSKVT